MKEVRPYRFPMLVVLGVVFVIGGAYVIYLRSVESSSPLGATYGPVRGGLSSLPVADFSLKEGSAQGLVQAYCTTCHSLAPIVRHEGFTVQTWADEVQKMRQQYGCPIDDATATRITEYLQKQYAAPLPPGRGAYPASTEEKKPWTAHR